MSAIFLLLWVVILVGLAGLTLQNLSLSISLVFLGLRSPSIPLGFLIIGAIAAGVLTGLIVTGLLNLLNRFQRRPRPTPRTRGPQFRPPWQPRSSNTDTSSQANNADSWDDGSDSWSWDSDSEGEPANQVRSYEVEQQPKTTHQSGSTYSYSYRDDDQTGVGRPESVVEADYRIITPPYQSDDIDDDYGFDEDFEDDDFEDEDKRRKQK